MYIGYKLVSSQHRTVMIQVHGRPQAWARGQHMREGRGICLSPSRKCWQVFLLQMLSKISVDEVFKYHLEKISSASGAQLLGSSLPDPHRAFGPCWGDFRHSPSLPIPGKNPADAHVQVKQEITTRVLRCANLEISFHPTVLSSKCISTSIWVNNGWSPSCSGWEPSSSAMMYRICVKRTPIYTRLIVYTKQLKWW